ncbi:MAG TPA: thioredoxin domain-containing protein, partial [Candidatus Acidoferrales bacterium]|nr:thioredoxin domain-containing protein [Candidatus Acidoferrales bacterium]
RGSGLAKEQIDRRQTSKIMHEHVKRALPILLLGVIGLALGIESERIHQNVVANPQYVTFCSVNSAVDCKVVMGSRYAEIGGFSVASLAIGYYLVVLAVAAGFIRTRSTSLRQQLSTVLLAMATGGLAFSFYMAIIALVVIKAVCLMCSGLYVVALAQFASTWRLRSATLAISRVQVMAAAGRDRMIAATAAAVVAVLVCFIVWEIISGGSRMTTMEEVKGQDPKFFSWYKSLPLTRVSSDGDNVLGSRDGPVTIVEFSDFGCGHCKVFHESLDEVLQRDGQGVRVVFRNFPLSSDCNSSVSSRIHPDSCLAAIAAECAGEQGKFWEYHNLLFDHQEQQGREFLLQYAGRLHLDLNRFGECLGSPAARRRVEQDAQMGNDLSIDSTPTVFINGRTIKGALDPINLQKALVLARDEASTRSN